MLTDQFRSELAERISAVTGARNYTAEELDAMSAAFISAAFGIQAVLHECSDNPSLASSAMQQTHRQIVKFFAKRTSHKRN